MSISLLRNIKIFKVHYFKSLKALCITEISFIVQWTAIYHFIALFLEYYRFSVSFIKVFLLDRLLG